MSEWWEGRTVDDELSSLAHGILVLTWDVPDADPSIGGILRRFVRFSQRLAYNAGRLPQEKVHRLLNGCLREFHQLVCTSDERNAALRRRLAAATTATNAIVVALIADTFATPLSLTAAAGSFCFAQGEQAA